MTRKLIAVWVVLLLCASAYSADKFEWLPKEAKEDIKGSRHKKGDRILPVVYTKIPKKTANRKLFRREYVIDLKKFNISNGGTNPEATSRGINQALQYAKKMGKNLIIFPKGTYLISEKDPIILDHKNTIIDLNGATLQINPNGLPKYCIMKITFGAENMRLTNGTLKGDRYQHDYATIKGTHEHGGSLRFISGSNIEVDHMLFTETTGFCVTSSKGMERIRDTGYRAVLAKTLESGGFDKMGVKIANPAHCRTSKPYDLTANSKRKSPFDGEFEFGFVFGYGSFQSIFDRNYTAFFYDKNMKFLTKMKLIQYKKYKIPKRGQFIHLEFNQPSAKPLVAGMVGSLTNMRAPVDVHFHHNRMYNNRSLGFAFCGGQRWIMEHNMFEKNGGGAAPHYGIDFEDGWDLMQDVVFRNNRFKDNYRGDLVVCAGSEMLFEKNVFEKGAIVWSRTHNYTFRDNIFHSNAGFQSRTGVAFIKNNTFKGDRVSIEYDARGLNTGLGHGRGMVVETPPITLENNTFENVSRIMGTYFNFVNCKLENSKFQIGKNTAMLHLEGCTLTNTSANYLNSGPKVSVKIKGCSGELQETGAIASRKITK